MGTIMRKHLIVAAVAALTMGGYAMADDLNYTYVQADGGAARLSGSGDHVSGSVFGVNGAFAFGSYMYGFADLSTAKYTESGSSLKINPISVGVGAHKALTPMVDLVGGASFERIEFKVGGSGNVHDSGWGLGAGLRGQATDMVQWNLGVKYRDVGDFQSVISVSGGGSYYFTPAFALGLDLSYSKYDKDVLDVKETAAKATFRYEFGR
jgi:hypothetical protein